MLFKKNYNFKIILFSIYIYDILTKTFYFIINKKANIFDYKVIFNLKFLFDKN